MERSTMSVQELSSQMGISLPKAYELVKQPGFPVLRIGTRILIPVDSFNAWLNRKAEGGENDGNKCVNVFNIISNTDINFCLLIIQFVAIAILIPYMRKSITLFKSKQNS